jgi:hypothetical protein
MSAESPREQIVVTFEFGDNTEKVFIAPRREFATLAHGMLKGLEDGTVSQMLLRFRDGVMTVSVKRGAID